MKKKHKNPPVNFCPRMPIRHAIDCYSARSKYHLFIVCKHFYGPLILDVWLPDYISLLTVNVLVSVNCGT